MKTTTIRNYREADRPALIGLVRELQAAECAVYDRLKPPEEIGDWYIDMLLADCARSAGKILVAEIDGALVGYAAVLTAVSSKDDADEIDYTYAYIKDLAVTAGRRGQGLGALLMAEAEALARAAGARWLRVSVLARNAAAVRLYEKAGFAPFVTTLEMTLDP